MDDVAGLRVCFGKVAGLAAKRTGGAGTATTRIGGGGGGGTSFAGRVATDDIAATRSAGLGIVLAVGDLGGSFLARRPAALA